MAIPCRVLVSRALVIVLVLLGTGVVLILGMVLPSLGPIPRNRVESWDVMPLEDIREEKGYSTTNPVLNLYVYMRSNTFQVGDRIPIGVIIRNTGGSATWVERLRSGKKEIGEKCVSWYFAIDSPRDEIRFGFVSRVFRDGQGGVGFRIPRLRQEDLIELKPGESVGVEVDVGRAICRVAGSAGPDEIRQGSLLRNVSGDYDVKVTYDLRDSDLADGLSVSVWTGAISQYAHFQVESPTSSSALTGSAALVGTDFPPVLRDEGLMREIQKDPPR